MVFPSQNRSSRAWKKISKVVALVKNSASLKQPTPNARFTRQKAGSKQVDAAKPSLVYKRARYYDTSTGEFTSQDPLEYVDGMSLFRGYFAPGDVDPSGNICQEDCPRRKTKLVLLRPHSGNTDDTIGVQIETVSPFSRGFCGGFTWTIQWKLMNPAGENGGYILQHVRMTLFVSDCDGNDITKKYKEPYWNHPDGFERWEAFEVNPHRRVTKSSEKGDIFNDTFAGKDRKKCTKGFAYFEGKYGYVDGKLPDTFQPIGPPTGVLPAMATDPKIDMGHTRDHSAIVEWDCCPDEKAPGE